MPDAIEYLNRHSSAKRLNTTFILANALGIVLYLVLASRGWRIPEEHGMVPVTGEPFVWADALPVLGLFALVDITWGGLLLRHKEWRGRPLWLVTVVMWLLVLVLDFSHH
jgi:hypothetical protein